MYKLISGRGSFFQGFGYPIVYVNWKKKKKYALCHESEEKGEREEKGTGRKVSAH